MDTQTVAQPGAVALEPPSTVLNPQTVSSTSGGGKPDLTPDKGNSIESVLDAELARMKSEASGKIDEAKDKVEDAEKAETKASDKDAPKPEKARADDGKFAKADKATEPTEPKAAQGEAEKPATGKDGSERRQSEGRLHQEPPSRFLPEARAKWANVPNEVKAEFHRVAQEMEQENGRYRSAHERYEPIREFDEIAKSNGRELKDSLAKVVQVENVLARDIVGGLDMILREIGPRKQDGSPTTLHDVLSHVARNGYQPSQQAYQQPHQSGPNPEIQALRQELNSMRAEQTVVPVIQEFQRSHPDFDALSPQIEAVLSSGVIDQLYGTGLSLEQRLAEAYRMAGGSSPSRSELPVSAAHSDADPAHPVDPDAGRKSIRGAPDDGADTAVEERNQSLEDTIRKELRKFKSG